MTDKTLYIQVASEKLHKLMRKELNDKLNNLNKMRELLEKELQTRGKFGCTVDDTLDDLAEILEAVREREYNRGYVDCAKRFSADLPSPNESH